MSKEIKPHIKVIQHHEQNIRTFHLTEPISETNEVEYPFGDMVTEEYGTNLYSNSDDDAGRRGQILVEQIMLVDGVIGGVLKKYSIMIKVGEAFASDDVYPIVLWKIIKYIFPKTVGQTIQISTAIIKTREDLESDDDKFLDSEEWREIKVVDREIVEIKTDSQGIDIEHLFCQKEKKEIKTKKTTKKINRPSEVKKLD